MRPHGIVKPRAGDGPPPGSTGELDDHVPGRDHAGLVLLTEHPLLAVVQQSWATPTHGEARPGSRSRRSADFGPVTDSAVPAACRHEVTSRGPGHESETVRSTASGCCSV